MHIMAIRDKKKKNKRALNSNRGSAAIIAIVFMMFLLIIGGSFMPLMSSEIRHASMDMDEQQAWYAAEAGIKFAKAYASDAKTIKESIGQKLKVISDNDAVQYVLKIVDPKDSSVVTSSTLNFPESDKKYIVYSEGIFNGVKKVITEEMVFAKSSSSGGNSGGESGGGTSGATVLPGLMSAGTIDLSQYNSGYSRLTGDLYAENDLKRDSGYGNDRYNFYQKAGYSNTLFTEIASSWFPGLDQVKAKNYTKLLSKYTAKPDIKILKDKFYYVDSTTPVDWAGNPNGTNWNNYIAEIDGESGAVLYVYNDMNIQKIIGPDNGVPFTVVFVNDQESTKNVETYGNVRILAKSSLILDGGAQRSGKLMVLTNGNLTLIGWSVVSGFISANNNIKIRNGGFVGQMMAKDTIYIQGGLDITYNNTVLSDKNFWLPEWS